MYDLPSSIIVDDKEYSIRNKGDFRVILDCFVALNDTDLPEQLRVLTCMIIFFNDFNSIEDIAELDSDIIQKLVEQMYLFFNCGETSVGASKPYRLVDWENDSQLIMSSINVVAHKEIRLEPFVHWWTFMGYYLNIGEGPFSNIVTIREKIVKHKKLEDYEKEFKKDNPQYFNWEWRTEQEIAEDKLLMEMWKTVP